MKKIILVLVLVMTMGLIANAQSDGFFRGDGDGYSGRESSQVTPKLPHGGIGSIDGDQPAPLGSGLLILSMLGGAYLLRKKN